MTRVICDTNVWYRIADGRFVPPQNVELIPTELTLIEIVSSENMLNDPELFQKTIRAIHNHGGKIIPVNPFEFVLSNQSARFSIWDSTTTSNILKSFESMLEFDFTKVEIPKDLNEKVRSHCKLSRSNADDFVNHSNSILSGIQQRIKESKSKKDHLKKDKEIEIKEMIVGFLNHYLETKKDSIPFDHITWSYLELFVSVSSNFFKKLETSPGMKVHHNDATDWLNIMYVEPGDKYLTFEKKWKNFIIEDPIIAEYFYKND